jgi:hypothetical protein
MAKVLRIETRKMFVWMNGNEEPDSKNSFRIRLIKELGEEWNKLCILPAQDALQISFEGGLTLLNELCQEVLDFNKISQLMDSAAQFVNIYEVPKYADNKIHKKSDRISEYDMLNLRAYFLEEE